MHDRILVNYGGDPKSMAKELMKAARIDQKVSDSMHIALKPNLVVAKPASSGATTHPELLAGVIEYLFDCGCRNIEIIEGAWIGESTKRAFKAAGYEELSRKYGVRLFDTKNDAFSTLSCAGLDIAVCESALKADYLINLPVLKAHCQTVLTCALKNLKGCISDAEKRHFHSLGLHRPIAALNKLLKQDLVIVDAIMGDLSFEEGGNPVEMGMVMLCDDPVLMDSHAAELIGCSPDEIPYIGLSAELGVGCLKSADTEIVEYNSEKKPVARHFVSRSAKAFERYIDEDRSCSACYASLIHALHRMGPRELSSIPKLHIGQGFKGKSGEGVGIGKCCGGFSSSVVGCPPSAKAILNALRE